MVVQGAQALMEREFEGDQTRRTCGRPLFVAQVDGDWSYPHQRGRLSARSQFGVERVRFGAVS